MDKIRNDKNSKIKVSFIIPARNEEEYVGECLDSVLSSQYSNLEINVVNDGSTDSTEKIVKEMMRKDKRIKIYSFDKGHSAAFARNYGANKATGEILIFLDSDAKILPDFAKIIVDDFNTFGLDGIAVKTLAASPSGFISSCIKCQRSLLWDNSNDKRVEYTSKTGALLSVFSKKAYEKLNGFSEDIFYFEDSDISKRFLEFNFKAIYEPKTIQFHHDPNSINETIRQSKWFGRGIGQLLKTHGIKKIRLTFVPIYAALFTIQVFLILVSWILNLGSLSTQLLILIAYLVPLIAYLIKMALKSGDFIHSIGFGGLFLIRNNYKFVSMVQKYFS